jgi:hypothetical protein
VRRASRRARPRRRALTVRGTRRCDSPTKTKLRQGNVLVDSVRISRREHVALSIY